MSWETVVGLEVHAQLLTRTKLFCGCATSFGEPPNTRVCPACLGLPGALPVLNAAAVRLALAVALALGCELRNRSVFARKNYFYPDLPKGYQISQFEEPYAEGGRLELDVPGAAGGRTIAPRIRRVHVEEDAGKSVHRSDASIVDLDRAGTPLVEIVGEPDLRSGADAAEYLRELRAVLMFVGACDGNLEQGSFRCDANVSVRRAGSSELGTRVELKNINSFRFVQKAIDHEAARQRAILEGGGRVAAETRGWDEDAGATFSMRSKETAQDYRYFPDPDLPPLVLEDAAVARARAELPELPRARRARWTASGLTSQAAGVLSAHPGVAAFFDEVAAAAGDPVRAAAFVQAEVLRDTSTRGLVAELPVTPAQLASILALARSGAISGKQAKELYARVAGTGRDPAELAREEGLSQVTDAAAIEEACRAVIAANPKQADAVRAGKAAVIGFLVGQVMKQTGGRANPAMVNDALLRLLGGS